MERLRAAPITELLELYLPLHGLLVLVRIIIAPFTNGATHGHQSIRTLYFSHGNDDIMAFAEAQL
jgi:hypothetical protein